MKLAFSFWASSGTVKLNPTRQFLSTHPFLTTALSHTIQFSKTTPSSSSTLFIKTLSVTRTLGLTMQFAPITEFFRDVFELIFVFSPTEHCVIWFDSTTAFGWMRRIFVSKSSELIVEIFWLAAQKLRRVLTRTPKDSFEDLTA